MMNDYTLMRFNHRKFKRIFMKHLRSKMSNMFMSLSLSYYKSVYDFKDNDKVFRYMLRDTKRKPLFIYGSINEDGTYLYECMYENMYCGAEAFYIDITGLFK